jgi:hypothetical protein
VTPKKAASSSVLGRLGRLDPLGRLGRTDPLGRLGRLSWRRPAWLASSSAIAAVVLASIALGLGASVVAVSAIASGVSGVSHQGVSSASSVVADGRVVVETMQIVSGTTGKTADWPKFTDSAWTVHVGDTVEVRITSFDDGTAPLTGAQTMFDHVLGTVNGTETVKGTALASIPDVNVAHTFTIVGLGFNMPIPAAPTGKSVTVVARFVATRAGAWVWQCYAPCGSGPNSMGGAMSIPGWMTGTIKVSA